MRRTLVLPMVLLSISFAGMLVESRTSNRDFNTFPHSGYAWPKLLLWRGIRTSPGSLWFFFGFLTAEMLCYLLFDICDVILEITYNENFPPSRWQQLLGSQGIQKYRDRGAYLLGSGLLYLSLSVLTLSDVMEAYLAGMAAVQVVLSTSRVEHPNPEGAYNRMLSMRAFQIAAVFGIAMLDSYHQLNFLNAIYSGVALVMNLVMYFTDERGVVLRSYVAMGLSLVQAGFTLAAFILAERVEGTHRAPIISILASSCAFTGFLLLRTILSLVNRPPDFIEDSVGSKTSWGVSNSGPFNPFRAAIEQYRKELADKKRAESEGRISISAPDQTGNEASGSSSVENLVTWAADDDPGKAIFGRNSSGESEFEFPVATAEAQTGMETACGNWSVENPNAAVPAHTGIEIGA